MTNANLPLSAQSDFIPLPPLSEWTIDTARVLFPGGDALVSRAVKQTVREVVEAHITQRNAERHAVEREAAYGA